MKKRFSAIFTIAVAAVLISSVAYAAKKKLQSKSKSMTPDVSEVDLAAGLLDAKGDHKHKLPKDSDTSKHGDEVLKDLTVAKQTIK
jgi:hypothetical protein